MSLLYDEGQLAIAREAERIAAQIGVKARLLALLETPGTVDETFWQTIREQGWTALAVPEAYGGLGLGLIELGIVCQALGAATAGAPFLTSSYGAIRGLVAGGDEALRQKWLPRLASGEAIGTFAFAERQSPLPSSPQLQFANGRLTGIKHGILAGSRADIAVVYASAGGEPALVLAELSALPRSAIPGYDGSRCAADLVFDAAPATLLLKGEGARIAARDILARLAVSAAHEAAGGAEAMMNIARDYAVTRKAFGQPIGAFQSVKHRIAELYALVELAKANCIRAAAGEGGPDFFRDAAAARLSATEAYDTAARDGVQVHGGIGVTWEAGLHLHMRRARSLAVETGHALWWEDALVDALVSGEGEEATSDLGPTDLDAYRAAARAWLEAQQARYGGPARKGLSEADELALARRYQQAKFDAGYAGINWPRDVGGQGLSPLEKMAFQAEELGFDMPNAQFGVSLNIPVPVVIRFGEDRAWVRSRVTEALRGNEIWCQLFSEPAAGSDLAGLRTRAVQSGDDWVVNGQKLWTSYAHLADYGVIVVRTDPAAPKHRGLTYFWIDMKTPGVTVRPVRLAASHSYVNEVFFDDVRLPDSQRLSPVGGGFAVAIATLMIERYSAGDANGFGPPLDVFITLAREVELNGRPALEDGRIRSAIARNHALRSGLEAITARAMAMMQAGMEPGPEGSLNKLVSVRSRQKLSELAMDLRATTSLAMNPDTSQRADWIESWLSAPAMRIAGGADEMLLNTIAEKILGLPQDHRPDKGVPFNEIPA